METKLLHLLEGYRDRMRERFATAPADLREDYIPTLGSGSLSAAQVDDLEKGLPVRLPMSFRSYLTGPRLQRGPESSEIELPPNDDSCRLRSLLNADELWPIQLLQFASGPCGDPVCFDTSTSENGGEFEVVVINHDWVGEHEWSDPIAVRRWVSARWPSFHDLLWDVCKEKPITFKEFTSA